MPASIDGRDSGLGAAAPHSLLRGGERAAREGRAIRKFLNGLTGIGANAVLTQAAIVYNVALGRRIMLAELMVGMHSVNDNVHVDLGWTTAANGGGTFTPLTAEHDFHTGNVQAAPSFSIHQFYPLVMTEYSAAARSVTLRVTANDANAIMTLCWAGWWEFE